MKKNKILIFIVIVTAIVAVIRTVSAQNRVKQLKREEYGGGDREYSLVMEEKMAETVKLILQLIRKYRMKLDLIKCLKTLMKIY